jgi:hypothetical protein
MKHFDQTLFEIVIILEDSSLDEGILSESLLLLDGRVIGKLAASETATYYL